MGNSEQDSKIQISISGTFTFYGPKADYTHFLKTACCIIAMDLDTNGNKKTQYLISYVLFEHIQSKSNIYPSTQYNYGHSYGVITNSESLQCNVDVKNFTEHPYINTFFSNNGKDTFLYFVGDNTSIKLTYDLKLSIEKFDENNRKDLVPKGYCELIFKYDTVLIDTINNIHQKSLNTPCALKSFIAETVVVGLNKLYTTAPILSKLDAAFGMQLNVDENKIKTELNNVE